jgi:hypothetical protein
MNTTDQTMLTPAEVAANDHGLECTTLADERCEIEPQKVWPTLPYITGDLLDKAMRNASWGLCQESIDDMNKDLAVIAKHDGEPHVRKNLYGILMNAMRDGLKVRAELCERVVKSRSE